MNAQADYEMGKNVDLTAEIISAYVSNNSVPITELAAVLSSVHAALVGLANGAAAEPAGPEKPSAVQIKKSVTPDALISFEDGKSYKALKRHLTLRGLTPEDYRAKYGLPVDYPMTSANYSAQRSKLAHTAGLGQLRRKSHLKAVPAVAAVAETISEAPKTRGRPRKAVEEPAAAPKTRARKKAAETP